MTDKQIEALLRRIERRPSMAMATIVMTLIMTITSSIGVSLALISYNSGSTPLVKIEYVEPAERRPIPALASEPVEIVEPESNEWIDLDKPTVPRQKKLLRYTEPSPLKKYDTYPSAYGPL